MRLGALEQRAGNFLFLSKSSLESGGPSLLEEVKEKGESWILSRFYILQGGTAWTYRTL